MESCLARCSKTILADFEKRDPELFARVGPLLAQREPARRGETIDTRLVVLVGVLGPDGFPALQVNGGPGHVNHVGFLAHQMHLDATRITVEEGPVLEHREIEVGPQLPVQPAQDVPVELGREAPASLYAASSVRTSL